MTLGTAPRQGDQATASTCCSCPDHRPELSYKRERREPAIPREVPATLPEGGHEGLAPPRHVPGCAFLTWMQTSGASAVSEQRREGGLEPVPLRTLRSDPPHGAGGGAWNWPVGEDGPGGTMRA